LIPVFLSDKRSFFAVDASYVLQLSKKSRTTFAIHRM